MPDGLDPTTRSTVHQRLRDSTRSDHLRLEGALNLLDPQLTRERYRRVLAAFLGFYAPLEAQLRCFRRATALVPGFSLPHRAALLQADLAVLGNSHAANDDESLADIRSVADFAGRLYVVEGAALGGLILARHLAGQWGLDRDSGAAFFSGTGPRETRRRWARVLTWLEREANCGANPGEMATAACATFRTLERRVTAYAGQS